MSSSASGNVVSMWFVVAAVMASAADAQTIELRSAHVSALEGAERERFLAAHNTARRAVDVDLVHWSDEVSKYAFDSLEQQKETLIEAAKEGWSDARIVLPTHRAEPKYGENVAGWNGATVRTAEWAVAFWLREKAAFDKLNANAPYRVGDEVGKSGIDDQGKERPIVVGHYTAMIWRTTKQIGAAKLTFELVDDQGNARSYVAIICNYSPPGNKYGERPY